MMRKQNRAIALSVVAEDMSTLSQCVKVPTTAHYSIWRTDR